MRTTAIAAIATIALMAQNSNGQATASVTLAWNPNPPGEQVTHYTITAEEVFGMRKHTVTTTNTTATITGLQYGQPYFFSATATNETATSQPCDPITYTPPETVTLTIQIGDDLDEFTDIGTPVKLKKQARQFYRLKIEHNKP